MLDDDLVLAGEAGDAEQRAFAAEVHGRGHRSLRHRRSTPASTSSAERRRRPVLMELEAIEPYLYLGTAPGAAERFARAALAS